MKPTTTAPFGQKFGGPKKPGVTRVLIVGAGSSHDFPRWFLGSDADTLRAAGFETASTPNLEETLTLMPQADVLLFSANHGQFGGKPFMDALNKFADEGKGVIILHAGTWRNYNGLYNKRFVCGGAKSHGHGNFQVTNAKPEHPVMKGVPATFTITDESYHAEIDYSDAAEILAINAPDNKTQKPHPSVWTVSDPRTRIVCITLGHDDKSHHNPAFKTILVNAATWVSTKK